MIDVRIKIFEHGPQGLQVNVFGSGAAASEREQIYAEELQPAIRAGLEAAGARVAEAGLGKPLSPGFLETVAKGGPTVPAPLGPDAVEIKLGAQVAPDGPPKFTRFSADLVQELRTIAAQEREANIDEGATAMADRLAGLVANRCKEFMAACAQHFLAGPQNKPDRSN